MARAKYLLDSLLIIPTPDGKYFAPDYLSHSTFCANPIEKMPICIQSLRGSL